MEQALSRFTMIPASSHPSRNHHDDFLRALVQAAIIAVTKLHMARHAT